MKQLTRDYFTTAIWSSTGPDYEPLDAEYSADDISDELILEAEAEIDSFIEQAGALLDGLDMSTVMHDFWLTRNRHGAGFWDGDYEKSIGEKLTKLSESFGEVDLYVGDDSKLYI